MPPDNPMREYSLPEKQDLTNSFGHLEKTEAFRKASSLIVIGKRGRVVALCGPNGTVIMAQILSEMNSRECVYIGCHDGDDFDDLCKLLRERRNEGAKMAFVDGIAKTSGFLQRCSALHDYFTRLGFPVVMSGSGQLFRQAEERELFDRVEIVSVPEAAEIDGDSGTD